MKPEPRPVRRRALTFLCRSPRWARWLALFAVVSAVSLYSIEATHFHHTLAEQLHCPAGHAVGHSPVNVFTHGFTATLDRQWSRDKCPSLTAVTPVSNTPYFIPYGHAPPLLVS